MLTCRIYLKGTVTQIKICPCWVPGCIYIDEFPREGTTTESQYIDYGTTIAALKFKYDKERIKEAKLRWINVPV